MRFEFHWQFIASRDKPERPDHPDLDTNTDVQEDSHYVGFARREDD